MLAKMHDNDLSLDIEHMSNNQLDFNIPNELLITGSSVCAKQGVQNQYSDGDDESDDLSSNVSAL